MRSGLLNSGEVKVKQARTWKFVSDTSLSRIPNHLRSDVATSVLSLAHFPASRMVSWRRGIV